MDVCDGRMYAFKMEGDMLCTDPGIFASGARPDCQKMALTLFF